MGSFGDIPIGIFAIDHTEAGPAIPLYMDRTQVIHEVDSAVAAGDEFGVVGVIHVEQFHTSAFGVLFSEMPQCLRRDHSHILTSL